MRSAVLALLAACSSPAHSPVERPGDLVHSMDRESRIYVAQLEALRGNGLDQLIDLALHGSADGTSIQKVHERRLALRGLGRIGGVRAGKVLREALEDPEVATTAAEAIGIAASLDEPQPEDADALVASKGERNQVLEALGRVAPGPIPMIAQSLREDATAEAAALACGRLGRRKLAIDATTRARLAELVHHKDKRVRYAATYALSREVVDPADQTAADHSAIDALAAVTRDPDAEIRATAIAGLAKHKAKVDDAALLDPDWRVAVEAVRALASDSPDAVAAALVRRIAELRLHPAEIQVITEGERALADKADRPLVRAAMTSLLGADAPWIRCLAVDAIARADHALAGYATCALPDVYKLPLAAESHAGSLTERRELLAQLAKHADVRVRIAALPMYAAMWKESDAADHRAAVTAVASAIGSKDPVIAAAATDAAGALYDLADGDGKDALAQAIVVRATSEREPELGSALLELIADKKLSGGILACRGWLEGQPVQARAAQKCLSALGEAARIAPSVPAAQAPPVDVTTVIGKRLEWHLTTDRGEVVIELSPDDAPWAVASIVALTRRGFYDGLEFHRVVPDFVVQGGDPTQTGGGGPGYLLPSEPSAGAGYAEGGVGMADSGRDSGGSQYFAMHARAPHLDGRYTWVGVVTVGQAVADQLVIGDRVKKAVITER